MTPILFEFGARPESLVCDLCGSKPLCGMRDTPPTLFLCAWCFEGREIPHYTERASQDVMDEIGRPCGFRLPWNR